MGQAIGRGPSPSFLPLHSSQIVSSEGSTAHARRTSEILEYRTGEACGTEKIASSADGFCLPGSAWEVWPVPSPPLSPGCLGWGGQLCPRHCLIQLVSWPHQYTWPASLTRPGRGLLRRPTSPHRSWVTINRRGPSFLDGSDTGTEGQKTNHFYWVWGSPKNQPWLEGSPPLQETPCGLGWLLLDLPGVDSHQVSMRSYPDLAPALGSVSLKMP